MFCSTCGASVPDDAVFCGKCGADLRKGKQLMEEQAVVVQEASAQAVSAQTSSVQSTAWQQGNAQTAEQQENAQAAEQQGRRGKKKRKKGSR